MIASLGAGCVKTPPSISANDMLVGKKWYLEQRSIIRQTNTITHSYMGLPTFWFHLSREISDSSYSDSDGYVGSHRVVDSANVRQINIFPVNRGAARSYTILHVGFEYLVVEYTIDEYLERYYFSSRL